MMASWLLLLLAVSVDAFTTPITHRANLFTELTHPRAAVQRRPRPSAIVASADWVETAATVTLTTVAVTGVLAAVGTGIMLAGSAEFMLPLERKRALRKAEEENRLAVMLRSSSKIVPEQ